jgi:hypothetical protein
MEDHREAQNLEHQDGQPAARSTGHRCIVSGTAKGVADVVVELTWEDAGFWTMMRGGEWSALACSAHHVEVVGVAMASMEHLEIPFRESRGSR